MLSKVLVPLDGSELSERILVLVRRLLVRRAAEVRLLTVVEHPPKRPSKEWEDGLAAARVYLAGLEERLRLEGIAAVAHDVVPEDPAEGILQAVSVTQPTFVAMATHGRSGLVRWARGSVAERVLRRCPVPLLLCNPGALEAAPRELGFSRILVPLDGSPESAEVLPVVADLARVYEAEVLLLMVGNFAVPVGRSAKRLSTVEEVEDALRPFAEQVRSSGVARVRLLAAVGAEAQEILEAVERERPDLLALTTHGRSGLSRWWFGSTAESLLRAATIPVLVRRTAERPAEGRDDPPRST